MNLADDQRLSKIMNFTCLNQLYMGFVISIAHVRFVFESSNGPAMQKSAMCARTQMYTVLHLHNGNTSGRIDRNF